MRGERTLQTTNYTLRLYFTTNTTFHTQLTQVQIEAALSKAGEAFDHAITTTRHKEIGMDRQREETT